MSQYGMRQVEERHVANPVDLMVWNNELDLIALSNFKGEVQVHRLHWQKVWNLSPPRENSTASAMAWRPDGKTLAIGYSCGRVTIVEVEDKETIHTFTLLDEEVLDNDRGVTSISWSTRSGKSCDSKDYNLYDDASIFLPNPPTLNSNYKNKTDENQYDFKNLKDQNNLNILAVGFGNGSIHLSIFGKFPCGVINLTKFIGDAECNIKILDAQLSQDFSLMQVAYVDLKTNNLKLATIGTKVLSDYSEELFLLANKHTHIYHYLWYIDQTMISITEAWEHILFEMDSKVAEYAASVPEGAVSADFLDLLMLGVPSDELELFLLQELTAKGLKKFGSSVELSYSTIQKLVAKQLNIVGQSLSFYLSELRGYARIPDRYEMLGLDPNTVTESIKSSCAFLNKCLELQQVIYHSMRDYKSFFRWLYVVIVKLLEEQIAPDFMKITQQELSYIAEFLYNFDKVDDSSDGNKKTVRFNLEKLSQYLADKELTILPKDDENTWLKYLEENPCLKANSEIIHSMSEFKKFSLIQQQKHLKKSIEKVFAHSAKTIETHYKLLNNILCYSGSTKDLKSNNYRLSQLLQNDNKTTYIAFTHLPRSQSGFYLLELILTEGNLITAKGININFQNFENLIESKLGNDEYMLVMDLQFYSTEILSILLQHPNSEISILIQFPLKPAASKMVLINIDDISEMAKDNLISVDGSQIIEAGALKVMEKMSALKLAVSGGRKVVVVLSKSLRKVRIFDMQAEGDEDDDETLDSTPHSTNTTQNNVSNLNNSSLEVSALNISESIVEEPCNVDNSLLE